MSLQRALRRVSHPAFGPKVTETHTRQVAFERSICQRGLCVLRFRQIWGRAVSSYAYLASVGTLHSSSMCTHDVFEALLGVYEYCSVV